MMDFALIQRPGARPDAGKNLSAGKRILFIADLLFDGMGKRAYVDSDNIPGEAIVA
jgi:hypothetical protein